jgi:hypothetical protein
MNGESLDSSTPRASGTLRARARWLLAILGAAAFGAGTLAVFAVHGNGGAGGAALLAAGFVALAIAAVGVVPRTLKFAGVEVGLHEEVKRLAAEAERQGRPDVAAALKVSAELAATAEPFTQAYESVRRILPPGRDRTEALNALFRAVETEAKTGRWSAADARALFVSGHEGARVFALAMMRAAPRPSDIDLAQEAVLRPKSNFEQWHALSVLERMLPTLGSDAKEALATSLRDLTVPPDTGRERLRDQILSQLGDRQAQ